MPDYSTNALDQIPEKIDFLILDSEHSFDTLSKEVELYEPRVRECSLIFLHDMLVFPEMAPVVYALQNSGRFEIITLETPRTYQLRAGGSGVTLLRKHTSGARIISEDLRIRNRTAREYYESKGDPFARLVLSTSLRKDLDHRWD